MIRVIEVRESIIHVETARGRRRRHRLGVLPSHGAARPRRNPPLPARTEPVWPEPGAAVPDELLLALMA